MEQFKKVYFIGIGGIGMSALARFFNEKGTKVFGYDRRPTPLTRLLEKEGMDIQYVENTNHVPKDVDLVVYTPAIPASSELFKYAQALETPFLKRADVLEKISKDYKCVAIAGTHGKTTITTMTAFLLRASGFGCNAFLGGVSANFQTNYWTHERPLVVIEADEYDRSFLKLHPDIAILSAVSADHLDIFGSEEAVLEAFKDFVNKISENGVLIVNQQVPKLWAREDLEVYTYGLDLDKGADFIAMNIQAEDGGFRFDILDRGVLYEDFFMAMGGRHNVENVLAAYAVSRIKGIEIHKIKAAMHDFKGVKRRYEYIVNAKEYLYIDDYAHHPEELFQLLNGVKKAFPEKKVKIIFQPHLFSRTQSFYKEFGGSLSLADEVVLLPIYPARELPIKGVNTEMMVPFIELEASKIGLDNLENVVGNLEFVPGQILISAGAGDIDQIVEKIKEKFEQNIGYGQEK